MFLFIQLVICRKAKRVVIDFLKENENLLDELKIQFNILDNGYAVDLSKVTNSLLQGTLYVIFTILKVPLTNSGYFWNEEDYCGSGISALFEDELNLDFRALEEMDVSNQLNTNGDANAIDLDDLDDVDNQVDQVDREEEVTYGPALPTVQFITPARENGKPLVGPMLPPGSVDYQMIIS